MHPVNIKYSVLQQPPDFAAVKCFMSEEFAVIMSGITSAVSCDTQRQILVNRH